MIGILDYGSGNIHAIQNIYKRLNIDCMLVTNSDQLSLSSRIVLAGVGAFDETMRLLNDSGMKDALHSCVVEQEKPVLGVCVGMQIMGSSSEEGESPGLGWINGRVKKFDPDMIPGKPKLPHMGWNSVSLERDAGIFESVDLEQGFYFLHSYYFECEQEQDVMATTVYGSRFCCAFNRANMYGFQFHPEKSHSNGIAIFKNFASL